MGAADVPPPRRLLGRRAEPICPAALTPPRLGVVEDGGELPGGIPVVAPDTDVSPGGSQPGLDVVDLAGQGLLDGDEGRAAGGAEAELREKPGAPGLPGFLAGGGGRGGVADVEGDDAQRQPGLQLEYTHLVEHGWSERK